MIAAGVTLVMLLVPVRRHHESAELPPEDTLRCVVPSEIHRNLVLKYAQDQGVEIDVSTGTAIPEDILSGSLDLAILPDTAAIPAGLMASKPFLQKTVWVVRDNQAEALRRINHWMTELSSTRLYRKMEKGKLDRLDMISRYDGLIKKHPTKE